MPRLIPTDETFFELLEAQAELAARAARLLQELLRDPTRLDERIQAIGKVARDAGAATRDLVRRLHLTFVTPFDADDILLLAKGFDDLVDRIDGASRRTAEFGIHGVREEAQRLAALLRDATEELLAAIGGLRHPRTLEDHIRRVKEVEEEGDGLYHAAIARLFAGAPDPLEVIKWKEIFETLAKALDRCDDLANTLSAISLKHS